MNKYKIMVIFLILILIEGVTNSILADEVADTYKTLDIYISAIGNDEKNGDIENPINTLRRAYDIATLAASEQELAEINIHILPGTYENQTLYWGLWNCKSTINIIGELENDLGKPVFDGTDVSENYFMYLINRNNSRFVIKNIQVQNYTNGIFLNGKYNENKGENLIEDIEFYNIGDYYTNSNQGFGGVDIQYSNDNIIKSCTFSGLQNMPKNANLIHGVYLAYGSSNNEIIGNTFTNIESDPIRLRDNSNNNKIYSNTFTKTGKYGYCSEWYDPKKEETISSGNVFYNNILDSSYNDSQIDETAILGQIYKEKLVYDENTGETSKQELVYTAKLSTDSSRIHSYSNQINSQNEKRKYVSKIAIKEKPDKLEYIVNTDKLDLTGGIIDIVYATDSANIIDRVALTSDIFKVTGFDNTNIGINTIQVAYIFIGSNNQERTVNETFDVEIVGKNFIKGDINKDGKVTLYDAFTILRKVIMMASEDDLTEEEKYIMDFNGDKKVTSYDAFSFLRLVIMN